MAKTLYRTISEQVADLLRTDIISGEIEEDTLLKEQELSDRFEVSRGTIRHALMQLVAEGIVSSTPNIGMKVASRPTEESLHLIIDVRNNIEDFILRKVYETLRLSGLNDWEQILKEMKTATEKDDIEAFIDADVRFHRFFVSLYPDNHVTDLWEMARARMMMRYNRLKNLENGYLEHKVVFDHVAGGNLTQALSSLHRNVV